ncbi:hypothetical protein [Streptomyces albipurpureus]|uniref:Uncharacterized protein n=1 Tax=Streptomyces albipurpureus TaxID=2897419 RepID=A0ABT0UQ99_9ACTN|nr:hypothetical protein [Streptomyces sp. CWNU-1]MCM2390174.1 hypothetical protein [Streptomyces sp. CWNU-1]
MSFTTPGLQAFAAAVDTERQRQLAKWGDQRHPDGTGQYPELIVDADVARMACQQAAEGEYLTWLHILREEAAEALAETDPAKLRTELVQIAAVCAAWIHDIDTRTPPQTDTKTEAPFAIGFRLHHHGNAYDGVLLPGGQTILVTDPADLLATGAPTLDDLLRGGYHGAHIEWGHQTLHAEFQRAIGLLATLADPEPCRHDHHGHCRIHGTTASPCPHVSARELITRHGRPEAGRG